VSHDHHDHGHHDHGDGHPTPSLRSVFTNWRTYDAPFHVKLRLALRNTLIKIRTRSDCCGNYGEPGC
jgi:hypothetical protein